MGKEIERKFLLKDNAFHHKGVKAKLTQGYLNHEKERVVRIRIEEKFDSSGQMLISRGVLTIKGKTIGITKDEFEYAIPVEDATEILKMCRYRPIVKIRHDYTYKGKLWVIDEFLEENHGLVIAEIELESEVELFEKPEFIADEVSHDRKFSNAYLYQKPFCQWG